MYPSPLPAPATTWRGLFHCRGIETHQQLSFDPGALCGLLITTGIRSVFVLEGLGDAFVPAFVFVFRCHRGLFHVGLGRVRELTDPLI